MLQHLKYPWTVNTCTRHPNLHVKIKIKIYKIYMYVMYILYFEVALIILQVMDKLVLMLTMHVVHIGIDGLRLDCIELAPGGAPHLLTRFRLEVSL